MADVAMPNLPSELVEDILRRLPVKSLKRFCAVTKKWRSLIDSDRFVKLHLRHSLASLSNRHLIAGGVGVCTVALDSFDKDNYFQPPFRFKGSEAPPQQDRRILTQADEAHPEAPVRGISLKLQQEERERRMDFVPDESTASRWVEDQTLWASCVTVSIS